MSRREPQRKVTEIGAGGAGGEGLEVALGGADPQDADDEEVGRTYKHSRGDDIRGQEAIHQSLVAILRATS